MTSNPLLTRFRLFRNLTRILAQSFALGVYLLAGADASTDLRIRQLRFLHITDVYQIMPVDLGGGQGSRGGLARAATLINDVRKIYPDTPLVFSGDLLSPSVASRLFKGRQMIETFNALKVDLAVYGNHEFDFGPEVLASRVKESKFPWLGANVLDSQTKKVLFQGPSTAIKVIDGVKVGFFGVLLQDTKRISAPGDSVTFSDPFEAARESIKHLRRQGVAVIVALTHLNMRDDERLAALPGVDLVLGGHDHDVLQSVVGDVPIIKSGSDAKQIGRILMDFDPVKRKVKKVSWEFLPVVPRTAEDPEVKTVVDRFEGELNKSLSVPIAKTEVQLNATLDNREKETNLGNLMADVTRKAVGADIAILNGGTIRSESHYGPGELTRKMILQILPFENGLVKLELTGAQIKEALEHGLAKAPEKAGGFLQVSGIRFVYDSRKNPKSRLVEVFAGDQPLVDTQKYSVGMTTYLAKGGDSYGFFKGAKRLSTEDDGPMFSDQIIAELEKLKLISPKLEGRIKDLARPE
jgi:5'-nucleotidase